MAARLLVSASVLSVLSACAGPEPSATGPGRSTPPGGVKEAPRSPASDAATDAALGLDAFAAAVAAAWRADPAPVAVLPAFSDDPQAPPGTQVFATAAGERWAAGVLAALVRAAPDVEVWTPETVVREVGRGNRSLRDVRAAEDAIGLVARTDAGYLVYGSIRKEVVGGRLSGTTTVRVRSTCVRLPGGEAVVAQTRDVTGPAVVEDLVARLERGSSVLVGARAPAFVPSLDRELELTAARALRDLLRAHRAELAGRRASVAGSPVTGGTARALYATVQGTLRSRLPAALPGREAIALVDDARTADVELVPSFERGTDRYTLVLTAVRRDGRTALAVREPLEPRFTAELRQALP